MTRCLSRSVWVLAAWSGLALGAGQFIQLAEAQNAKQPDLSGYRTVDQAITTQISKAAPTALTARGYLGVHAVLGANGKVVVGSVEPGSPAALVGVKEGDQLVTVGGKSISNADGLRDALSSKSAGDAVQIAIIRDKQSYTLNANLAATSRLVAAKTQTATMAAIFADAKDGGLPVREVISSGPADKAGIKKDDVLVKVDGQPVNDLRSFQDYLFAKAAGDVVEVLYRRDGKDATVKVTLAAESGGGAPGSFDTRKGGMKAWKKSVYRLAIIGIEYADVSHNAKITPKDWQDSMFSLGTYNKTNVLGAKVHGSMHDYYKEQSFNKLALEGKMIPFVKVSKKRMDYAATGVNKNVLFKEVFEKVLARDGKDALKDYDGVFFLYAGGRPGVPRGSIYWPHRSNYNHDGKSWPYFIVQEGGDKMNDISVFCHEFGHMLGLPDLYARPENPGSEGVGQWCAMSNQVGGGRPQHFCAWSKEQLGWVTPVVIDPTVKQKLILSPIEDSPKECFKVLARADGSEYYLLENRKKKGWDSSLPAEGLLIWRVVANRPILEESHGVDGPSGPRVFPGAVPFPSPANDSFTPFTVPSSRPQLGGGLPVHITNIRRLPDGRITFHIGYEYY